MKNDRNEFVAVMVMLGLVYVVTWPIAEPIRLVRRYMSNRRRSS